MSACNYILEIFKLLLLSHFLFFYISEEVLNQTAKLLGVDLTDLLAGGCCGAASGAKPASTLQLAGLKVVAGAGETLIECGDEVEAVVALCLAHSVLNVKFSRRIASFMSFIQRYVLGIDDGIKPPQRCMRFVQQLQ